MQNLTYSQYLKLDSILHSQSLLSYEHDEMLFIIIHQTYELWFKQELHEANRLQSCFENGEVYPSFKILDRMLKILKTLVQQVDILETMTPIEFSGFRDHLDRASGFQSWQFRCLEFLLGFKSSKKIEAFNDQNSDYSKIVEHFKKPTLFDSFLKFLAKNNIDIPEDIIKRDTTIPYSGDKRIQETLIEIYHNKPNLSLICEKLVDFDEGISEWRYRHLRMVERTIGDKMGTGRSSGAKYLSATIGQKAFIDLWEIRNRL